MLKILESSPLSQNGVSKMLVVPLKCVRTYKERGQEQQNLKPKIKAEITCYLLLNKNHIYACSLR